MDPWAIMNTQEIWAQPSPPPIPTVVTNVTTATATRRIDTCVTAESITQLSPSLPLLSTSPPLPSTDGTYMWHPAILRRLNATVTTMETGRNEGKGDGKRHLGISVETKQLGRQKRGERLEDHPLDPGKSPPQPTSTITSFLTRYAPSGGNYPARQSVTAV